MKHIFVVNDINTGEFHLYYIECNNEDEAKKEFMKKYLPCVSDLDWVEFCEGIDKGFSIIIDYVGTDLEKL